MRHYFGKQHEKPKLKIGKKEFIELLIGVVAKNDSSYDKAFQRFAIKNSNGMSYFYSEEEYIKAVLEGFDVH